MYICNIKLNTTEFSFLIMKEKLAASLKFSKFLVNPGQKLVGL